MVRLTNGQVVVVQLELFQEVSFANGKVVFEKLATVTTGATVVKFTATIVTLFPLTVVQLTLKFSGVVVNVERLKVCVVEIIVVDEDCGVSYMHLSSQSAKVRKLLPFGLQPAHMKAMQRFRLGLK